MQDFNDPGIGKELIARIGSLAEKTGPVRIMEVCGTHTMAIGRFGIRKLLPEHIHLISGPGCPVCVTPGEYIDNTARIALSEDITVATFGDMIRVPGIHTSLELARAEGARIEVITNPLDILLIKGEVLFCAVGFETTAAPIAAAFSRAVQEKRDNISFYTSLKLIPPTLSLLCADEEIGITGFLLPGHVSTVIGSAAYGFLKIPSSISGFEMIDILDGIMRILSMISEGKTRVENGYRRAVTPEGNKKAQEIIISCFEPCTEQWRGIGLLPDCSLRIREEYRKFDARERFGISSEEDDGMPEGCACGEVLKGIILPDACPLFGNTCMPDHPVGPCMVSSEGSCAAFYKYERGSE